MRSAAHPLTPAQVREVINAFNGAIIPPETIFSLLRNSEHVAMKGSGEIGGKLIEQAEECFTAGVEGIGRETGAAQPLAQERGAAAAAPGPHIRAMGLEDELLLAACPIEAAVDMLQYDTTYDGSKMRSVFTPLVEELKRRLRGVGRQVARDVGMVELDYSGTINCPKEYMRAEIVRAAQGDRAHE